MARCSSFPSPSRPRRAPTIRRTRTSRAACARTLRTDSVASASRRAVRDASRTRATPRHPPEHAAVVRARVGDLDGAWRSAPPARSGGLLPRLFLLQPWPVLLPSRGRHVALPADDARQPGVDRVHTARRQHVQVCRVPPARRRRPPPLRGWCAPDLAQRRRAWLPVARLAARKAARTHPRLSWPCRRRCGGQRDFLRSRI
eukprot:5456695-Prymnesium_polylepis.1